MGTCEGSARSDAAVAAVQLRYPVAQSSDDRHGEEGDSRRRSTAWLHAAAERARQDPYRSTAAHERLQNTRTLDHPQRSGTILCTASRFMQ